MAGIDINQVYEQHAEEVYRFLLRLCGDAHLAEDLLQDTFLKAIEKIDSFDNRCKLTSWLCQIAKNDYYDYLRKKHRYPIEPLPDFDLPHSQLPLDDMLIDKELAKSIRMAVHQLPEPYKEVFLLRVYAELSFKEISQMFQKTEVWGRVTFLRAKEMILQRLEDNSPTS